MPNDGDLQVPNVFQFNRSQAPGRSVGDPEEMRRFQVIMSLPPSPDAQGYFNYLTKKIDQAAAHWKTYAETTGEQYARAYGEQELALKTLKGRYEARSKREEAFCTFALNLLTVGIGGPLAAQAAKFAAKGISSDKEFIEKAVDLAKEKVTEPIQKATEWGYKKLNGELAADPFVPASVTPAEFGHKVRKGIEARYRDMQDIIVKLLESRGGLSLGGIKKLCEQILPDPFIQSMPPSTLDESAIYKGALLSLWLAWGWSRDVSYWNIHGRTNDFYKYQDERLDFKGVMEALLKAGVPKEVASQEDYLSHWMNRYERIEEINMPGFIDWANSGRWCQTMARILPEETQKFWVGQLPSQFAEIKVKKMTAFMSVGAE